ncbi:MAG TPA: hypothetical protein VMG38_22585 [Trebonia sp.]|nr:hypothetical protein [Trebonia sp.]
MSLIAPRDRPSVRAVPRPQRGRPARRWAWAAGLAVLAAGLGLAYLHLSQAYQENSDEANILLMAADMAHGNLLLHGWNVSDVSFITTELPQIALLVVAFGLRIGTAHIAAAMTYTLVVLTAMALARGQATGKASATRMLVALAIMLAPQPGVGVFVLILSVGHIGTAIPVMLAWLALERYGTGRRPGGAALTAVILAWALVADPLVIVIAVLPLALVSLIRREWWLLAAAGAGYLTALGARALITVGGGYVQRPVPFALSSPALWYWHAQSTIDGLLAMFGAYFVPSPQLDGLDEAIAGLHLVSVVLVTWAALAAARGLFRRASPGPTGAVGRDRTGRKGGAAWPGGTDMISQLLLVGVVANIGAFVTSSLASASALNTREVAPVLPFAAVLAARTFGDRLAAGRLLARPVRARNRATRRPARRQATLRTAGRVAAAALVAATLGGYCLGLAIHAAARPAADPYAGVEKYLEGHHLTHGLSGYWEASYITVDTGGAVTVRAVLGSCLQPYLWEARPQWYRPDSWHPATFLLASTVPGYFRSYQPGARSLRVLKDWYPRARLAVFGGTHLVAGTPARDYLLHVYPADLMAQFPRLRAALQTPTAPCS